ncbi:MAG: DUF4364 family protein [Ruminococcaceae bacterium]|nr:DUF4364 family protein [Oscillospiraceae bacterium]
MFSDALNAGVNPGGLQSRTEIRVLICYLLDNISSPVPLDTVKEQLHFEGIANFFELSVAIAELSDSGHIISTVSDSNKTLYTLTDEGRNVANALSSSLPFSVKENSLNIANRVVKRAMNERQHKVSVDKSELGLHVTCTIMEGELELAGVKLLVPDDETAETVKENFLNNPTETLLNITSALTGMKL